MNTGKSAMQDPRMAPGKAPENAPDAMDKSMPEYPMDPNELVYPGEQEPFASKAGPGEGQGGRLRHPAVPPTEVPRDKLHLEPTAVKALMEECLRCVTACERCADTKSYGPDHGKYHKCITLSRACADICLLLHGYLGHSHISEMAHMAVDLAPVCARACEACALTCGQHPDMEVCVKCANACRACAEQCRRSAKA
jgi:hypothetical protein